LVKNSDDQEVFHLAALRANFSACDMKILSQYNWGILDLLNIGAMAGLIRDPITTFVFQPNLGFRHFQIQMYPKQALTGIPVEDFGPVYDFYRHPYHQANKHR
jgi:hypothetical protein